MKPWRETLRDAVDQHAQRQIQQYFEVKKKQKKREYIMRQAHEAARTLSGLDPDVDVHILNVQYQSRPGCATNGFGTTMLLEVTVIALPRNGVVVRGVRDFYVSISGAANTDSAAVSITSKTRSGQALALEMHRPCIVNVILELEDRSPTVQSDGDIELVLKGFWQSWDRRSKYAAELFHLEVPFDVVLLSYEKTVIRGFLCDDSNSSTPIAVHECRTPYLVNIALPLNNTSSFDWESWLANMNEKIARSLVRLDFTNNSDDCNNNRELVLWCYPDHSASGWGRVILKSLPDFASVKLSRYNIGKD